MNQSDDTTTDTGPPPWRPLICDRPPVPLTDQIDGTCERCGHGITCHDKRGCSVCSAALQTYNAAVERAATIARTMTALATMDLRRRLDELETRDDDGDAIGYVDTRVACLTSAANAAGEHYRRRLDDLESTARDMQAWLKTIESELRHRDTVAKANEAADLISAALERYYSGPTRNATVANYLLSQLAKAGYAIVGPAS